MLAGVLGGLLPAVIFLIVDPAAFWFGNFTYHHLNAEYWTEAGYPRVALSGKAKYFGATVQKEPLTWLLLLSFVIVLGLLARARGARSLVLSALLPMTATAGLMLAIWIPSPLHKQYLYAFSASLIFSFAVAAVSLISVRSNPVRYIAGGLLIGLAAASVVGLCARFANLAKSEAPTTTATLDSVAREIRAKVDSGVVATFAPIYVQQAGLDIYPSLSPGPFAVRIAPLMPEPLRNEFSVETTDELNARMERRPPAAILVGTEGAADEWLIDFARENSYRANVLTGGLTLWVKPSSAAP